MVSRREEGEEDVSGANLKMNPPTPACPSPAPVNAMWITDKLLG